MPWVSWLESLVRGGRRDVGGGGSGSRDVERSIVSGCRTAGRNATVLRYLRCRANPGLSELLHSIAAQGAKIETAWSPKTIHRVCPQEQISIAIKLRG